MEKRFNPVRATILFPILVAVVSVSCLGSAQDKASKIDSLMLAYNQYRQFNGSVLVAEYGKVIYKKGIGCANFEWKIPNTPETKFRIGSLTKQFTAMLIMQLVEQGKVKLDGKVTEYVPDYPAKTGDRITIHHLLTHTSGIPDFAKMPESGSKSRRNALTPRELVKTFADMDLEFEPGSKFNHSNSGYVLLGLVIENVTGQSYERSLRERILEPLNMDNTGYDHQNDILTMRAAGYERGLTGYRNAGYVDMSVQFSCGALYSTVEDLYRWDQALYSDKLLSAEYRNKMFTPFLGNYACGWSVRKVSIGRSTDSVLTVGREGGIDGFCARVVRLVDDKHLIVLMNNTGSARLDEISQAIINILYNQPFEPPKRSIAAALLKAMRAKGLEAAVSEFRTFKEQHSDEFYISEGEMNALGHHLLEGRNLKEAIEVFKLNVEAFPQSAIVYDSLGEAYMMNGDRELAIKNYEKSVELDRSNVSSLRILDKLKGKTAT